MDGNSRWAETQGMSRDEGHRAGAQHVRTVAEACADLGVRYLTLFAFSTENWQRPTDEVEFLIQLIGETLENELDELDERETQVRFIGDRSRFPLDVRQKLHDSEIRTAHHKKLFLTIALNYGGRWDLTAATREIAEAVKLGYLAPEEIDENLIQTHLSTRDHPAPDLCIRTGGERRISNFLLWDFAYTEFYFSDSFWPGFSLKELRAAFEDYSKRQRRFGARNATMTASTISTIVEFH
ncbi:MAG: di-trans,poly-cis-decaprenylcistransferase [Gammaproteobacteria bacterium]|nr:di-trans,poly-cis-decaprenylcistransferase [Gammaproteobacteria bacterium]